VGLPSRVGAPHFQAHTAATGVPGEALKRNIFHLNGYHAARVAYRAKANPFGNRADWKCVFTAILEFIRLHSDPWSVAIRELDACI
jgi:hypothetical protein